MKKILSFPLSFGLILAVGCGTEDDHDHDHMTPTESADEATPTATATATPTEENMAVTLNFAGRVGDETFACGTTYDLVGTTETDYTPIDFKMYISDVHLITADGESVALNLEDDGKWQYDRVTLLDFEDGSGDCTNGNGDLNHQIIGTVPAGAYTGVEFTVGVPFELNHADSSTAPSPLNITTMFWSWQSGYKFIRADGTSSGLPDGFLLHLGSTECEGEVGAITGCNHENRPVIRFDDFDPATDTIVADLGSLFSQSDLDVNTTETAPGCMSAPSDPECAPIFEGLGLPFAEAEAGQQRFLFVE